MRWVVFIVGGFLSGSVLYGYLIPELVKKVNIYEVGRDGNPGGTNVFLFCGKGWGILCIFLDILKGFLPVFLAAETSEAKSLWFALVMLAPVLGHALGVYNGFRGGKCISTAFGVLLGILPVSPIVLLLAGLYVGSLALLRNRKNEAKSIFTFLCFGISAFILLCMHTEYSVAVGCLLVSAVAIIKNAIKIPVEQKRDFTEITEEDACDEKIP